MIKNILAFITLFLKKRTELEKLQNEVDDMKKLLTAYAIEKGMHVKDNKISYTCGQYTVTITTCERTDIDKKRLEAEKPDIAKEYSRTTVYDRLTVK